MRTRQKMRDRETGAGHLWIAHRVYQRLLDEAHRADPLECCGLLLGIDGRIDTVLPTRNVHEAPATHFEIEPQALIDAHRLERVGGPQLMGYYHSHPVGDPYPSLTDRAMAAGDGRIWAIIALPGQITFWRDALSGFVALPHRVEGR